MMLSASGFAPAGEDRAHVWSRLHRALTQKLRQRKLKTVRFTGERDVRGVHYCNMRGNRREIAQYDIGLSGMGEGFQLRVDVFAEPHS